MCGNAFAVRGRYPVEVGRADEEITRKIVFRSACLDVGLLFVRKKNEELVVVDEACGGLGDPGASPFGGRDAANSEVVLLERGTLKLGDVLSHAVVDAVPVYNSPL